MSMAEERVVLEKRKKKEMVAGGERHMNEQQQEVLKNKRRDFFFFSFGTSPKTFFSLQWSRTSYQRLCQLTRLWGIHDPERLLKKRDAMMLLHEIVGIHLEVLEHPDFFLNRNVGSFDFLTHTVLIVLIGTFTATPCGLVSISICPSKKIACRVMHMGLKIGIIVSENSRSPPQ